MALHHEQSQSAAVLLDKGADPNVRSDQGMSAMAMASAEGASRERIDLMVAKGFKDRSRHGAEILRFDLRGRSPGSWASYGW